MSTNRFHHAAQPPQQLGGGQAGKHLQNALPHQMPQAPYVAPVAPSPYLPPWLPSSPAYYHSCSYLSSSSQMPQVPYVPPVAPSPYPPPWFPSSPAHYHSYFISRPPPFTLSLRYPSPFPSSLTTSHSPTHSFTMAVSSTRSSLGTLPLIPTSPSLCGLRSDFDHRQTATSALDESCSFNCNLRKKFRAPDAPLIFCHGLLGFDSLTIGPEIASLQVSHWGGMKEALEANGCEVLITRVPAMSSPVNHAKVLEKKILGTYPGRDVHLISHSMGGIDCRYLITHLTQCTFRVLSLTTISTPHHGSSFASHFLSLTSTRLPTAIALLQLLPNGDGDGKAFKCLTQEAMKEFNDNTQNIEGVRYFSWGADYEPGFIDPWKYSHSVIAAQEGENDGMVSVQSAQWGTYLGTLRKVNHIDLTSWTGGHTGLKGMHSLFRGKDMGFNAEKFYGGIADLLAGIEEEEGYVVDRKRAGSEVKEVRKKRTTEALHQSQGGWGWTP
ncbi:Alpha/Beta hydrolase fold [Tylopilus felleus]